MTCQICFARFGEEDFSLEDKDRLWALKKMETHELEELLEEDPRQFSYNKLNIS